MLYSKTAQGFYDPAIHGDNIPADAVEITTKEHAALLKGQSQGKIIAADKHGKPILKDPPPPTDDELAARIRAERDPLLLLADRKVNTLEDKGQDASAWRAWRDALRDISLQPTFPQSVEWPEQPA